MGQHSWSGVLVSHHHDFTMQLNLRRVPTALQGDGVSPGRHEGFGEAVQIYSATIVKLCLLSWLSQSGGAPVPPPGSKMFGERVTKLLTRKSGVPVPGGVHCFAGEQVQPFSTLLYGASVES